MDRIQLREAALKQHMPERRKPRRSKPVKAQVVSYTEENSGRCMPDVASNRGVREVFGSK